jgi:hypothetical protein
MFCALGGGNPQTAEFYVREMQSATGIRTAYLVQFRHALLERRPKALDC